MEEKKYFREVVETFKYSEKDQKQKLNLFETLCFNECFSNFLKTKFNTSKRFGNKNKAIPNFKIK